MDKKNLIKALQNTILVGATTHLTILAFHACRTKDLDIANIFNVLDFELIIPSLGSGTENFIYSWIFISMIFAFMYYLVSKKKKNA